MPVALLTWVMVIPLIDAVTPGLMAKMRTALLPLTVNRFAPGRVIVNVSLMVRTVPARTMVRGVLKTVGSNVIVFGA